MKLKVGDKVMFEVVSVDSYGNVKMMSSNRKSIIGFDVRETDNLDKLDMTADEAWEIVRKFACNPDKGGLPFNAEEEIFGCHSVAVIVERNTPREARDKIRAWEKVKEEAEKVIKVGDIVKHKQFGYKYMVVKIKNDLVIGFDKWGIPFCCEQTELTRTGEHVNIQSILDQIMGEEE